MERTLPALRLSNSPLVLVLCQVRIAAIRALADYIPKLQDRLRLDGFPVDRSGEVREMVLLHTQAASERRRTHWEFRTLEEDWSIILGEGAVVLQTTAYSNFDEFAQKLSLGMEVVDDVIGNLVVERIGLRYVDAIVPREGDSWKDYVKPGYHGQENEIIRSEHSALYMQTVASTGPRQVMVARLAQNREGLLIPPDLVPHHPRLKTQVA